MSDPETRLYQITRIFKFQYCIGLSIFNPSIFYVRILLRYYSPWIWIDDEQLEIEKLSTQTL